MLGLSRILITAGATREYIDDLRFITNPASGKLGIAIADEALARGYDVIFIHGAIACDLPKTKCVEAITSKDMLNAVLDNIHDCNAAIFTAAVTDFKPIAKFEGKLDSNHSITIKLKPTEKIIDKAREANRNAFFVACKAEFDKKKMIQEAIDMINKNKADLVVANHAKWMARDSIEAYIINKNKRIRKVVGSKKDLAREILNYLELGSK